MKPTLTLLAALLLAPLGALHAGEVDGLLARCQVIKTSPTPVANTGGYGTMSQCLLLGNGNLMVSVAGGPETITLFLGKTDYWRDRGHGKGGALWQSGNVLPGWLNLAFPAMKDAKFEQVQDMALAEVRTKLTKGGDVIEVRSVTPHEADNFVINDVANKGASAIEVRIETCTRQFSSEQDPFEISAGKDVQEASLTWVTRKAHQPPPPDPLPDTLAALRNTSAADTDKLIADHRAWWDAFWRKGWVQLDAEPLMQRVWFGCLYVFGCANKVGQWPAGCNGWPINDDVPWGGDYHWNYNHEAPYYGAYTANRLEGITIADSATHSLMLVSPYKAGHPNEVKRTKIFTWRANGDGINPFGNRLIEDPRPTLQQFFICMTMPGPYSKSAEKRVAGDLSGILFQFQAVNAATNLIRQNTP